jgi:hypothetical protein
MGYTSADVTDSVTYGVHLFDAVVGATCDPSLAIASARRPTSLEQQIHCASTGRKQAMNTSAEIEAIQRLKYRYFRAVDLKQFDKLRHILTEDCTARYDHGNFALDGREAIIKFLTDALPLSNMSLHQGHHPEIDLKSDNEAGGVWYFHDIVFYQKEQLRLEGSGYYEDRYRKVDGEWKIAHTGYRRNFEVVTALGEVKSWRNAVEEGLFSER